MSGKARLTEGSIEPEAHNLYNEGFDLKLCLQLSIASSLKRLADAFDRGAQ